MSLFARFLSITIIFFLLSSTVQAETLELDFKFNGIQQQELNNVEARLQVLKKTFGVLTTEKIKSIYEQAPHEIKTALQPYGYFRSQIQSQLSQNKSHWTAYFTVQLGAPIKITKLNIKVLGPGKNNSQIENYLKHFPIKVGDVFHTDVYEKTKEDLFQIASDQGYVKAFYSSNKILINVEKYQLEIIMQLETGHQYYFGKTHFKKNPYSKSFLQNFVTPLYNTPFSSKKLLQLQEEMSNSYYFQQATITPDFNHIEDDNQIPMNMNLIAPKAKKYNLGIGYGTFTGPRLTAGASFRRLTNDGQHFDTQLKLSSVLSGLAGKYYIPGKNPLTDQWLVGLSYQRFLPKNGASTSGSLEAGYMTKTKNSQTSINGNYLIENYKVKTLPVEKTTLLYPSFNFNYSNSDDLISPTLGKSFNFTLRGASKNIFSSTSFLQTELKGKYFFTPFDFAHIVFRGDLGYTVTKDLKKLPLSMRFFAGGLNSIRGYPDSSIGPGRYLYTGSIEYQNQLKGNWWAAAFYDAGTATNHYGKKLSKGDGLGLIYKSSIGPIKVYVAQTINQPKKHYSVELSIGPEF